MAFILIIKKATSTKTLIQKLIMDFDCNCECWDCEYCFPQHFHEEWIEDKWELQQAEIEWIYWNEILPQELKEINTFLNQPYVEAHIQEDPKDESCELIELYYEMYFS